jgi:hypothetical protein
MAISIAVEIKYVYFQIIGSLQTVVQEVSLTFDWSDQLRVMGIE